MEFTPVVSAKSGPLQLPDYIRPDYVRLLSWFERTPEHMLMLWGPRQSGKTTLIKQVLHRYAGPSRYISIDQYNEDLTMLEFSQLAQVRPAGRKKVWVTWVWSKAREQAQASSTHFVLVIDEVQKLDNWSQCIKGLYDQDRWEGHPIHVVLLGSSPFLLQKGLSESLLGRYLQIPIYHWSYMEMRDAFGLSVDEFIYYGGYPGAVQHMQHNETWLSYIGKSVVENNIHRDIMALIEIKRPKLMRQLYEMGALMSGQLLSFAKILKQLQGGDQELLVDYLDILERVWMLKGLWNYSHHPVHEKGPPKFQVLNTALMSFAYGYSFEHARSRASHWGRLVESAVGAHILNSYDHVSMSLSHWRRNGDEVDFVVRSGPYLVAIEVKSGVQSRSSSALSRFHKRYPQSKTLLVGAGGIPVAEFLAKSARHWCEV